MVGVPGRSKGCNTCRRRKIACTLERPHCFQCVKSGRVCLGYQKERIFVVSVASSKPLDTTVWRPDAYNKMSSESSSGISSLESDSTILKYQSLDNSAFREQMIGLFLAGYKASKAPGAWPSPFLTIIPNLPSPTGALQRSALAICTSRIARANGNSDDVLIHTSRKLYGQAICAMRGALSDPRLMLTDETLATCVLLALYEVLECPGDDRSAYLNHYNGCAKLIQLRGPDAHRTGVGHTVFQVFRTMGTFESLLNKRTFLSEPVWKTKTFSDSKKSPFDKLIDILLDAPAVIESAEAAFKQPSPGKQLEEAMKVARACLKLDWDLQQYYEGLKAEANGPLYWPVFPTNVKVEDLEDETPNICPVEYRFVDARLGNTLMVYWASLASVWSGLCHLYASIDELSRYLKGIDAAAATASIISPPGSDAQSDPVPSLADLPPLEHRTDFLSMVLNVYQSVEFCFNDEMTLPLVATPLNMCVNILSSWPAYERELEWGLRALERVRLKGIGIVKYLPRDNATPIKD